MHSMQTFPRAHDRMKTVHGSSHDTSPSNVASRPGARAVQPEHFFVYSWPKHPLLPGTAFVPLELTVVIMTVNDGRCYDGQGWTPERSSSCWWARPHNYFSARNIYYYYYHHHSLANRCDLMLMIIVVVVLILIIIIMIIIMIYSHTLNTTKDIFWQFPGVCT